MKERDPSKHIREISVDKAAELTNSNPYQLIVAAAQHARNIATRRNKMIEKEKKLIKFDYKPINQALDDFQHKDI